MDKNNLRIIKDMAKLFSATILSGLFFTGCVDMDLTPKNQPSEGEVWADATMAEQTVTTLYCRWHPYAIRGPTPLYISSLYSYYK